METQKRGRRKGAKLFAQISLAELNEYFKEKASITVSRNWLEALGFEVEESDSPVLKENVCVITSTINDEEEEKIEFTISE